MDKKNFIDDNFLHHLAYRIYQGDRSAETELYKIFHLHIDNIVFSRLNAYGLLKYLKDIKQEVWIELLFKLRKTKLDQQHSIRAFIFGFARNVIRKKYLILKFPKSNYEEYERENINLDEFINIIDDYHNVISKLNRALNTLKPIYYEIIKMRYFDRLSYAEISKMLKIPESTLRWRVNVGLKTIKRKLNKKKNKA